MRRDYLKMNMLWAITRLVNKLYGHRLFQVDISYGSYGNDGCGAPIIKIETSLAKTTHRLGIIQVSNKFVWGIKCILYCFNLKPYEV